MTNLVEFRSGTSPIDSTSTLRISATLMSPNLLQLEFFGALGRRYLIEWSDGLGSGAWIPITGFISGSNAPVQQFTTIPPDQNLHLFRVKLIP